MRMDTNVLGLLRELSVVWSGWLCVYEQLEGEMCEFIITHFPRVTVYLGTDSEEEGKEWVISK